MSTSVESPPPTLFPLPPPPSPPPSFPSSIPLRARKLLFGPLFINQFWDRGDMIPLEIPFTTLAALPRGISTRRLPAASTTEWSSLQTPPGGCQLPQPQSGAASKPYQDNASCYNYRLEQPPNTIRTLSAASTTDWSSLQTPPWGCQLPHTHIGAASKHHQEAASCLNYRLEQTPNTTRKLPAASTTDWSSLLQTPPGGCLLPQPQIGAEASKHHLQNLQ